MATASGAIPPGAPNNDGAATAVIVAWRAGPDSGRVLAVAGGMVVVAGSASWLGAVPAVSVAAVAWALLTLTLAAVVDLAEHRLPNALVVAAAVPVVVVVALAVLDGRAVPAGPPVGAVLCGGPLLATHLVSPSGLGFGDVKAAAVLGGALGLVSPVVAVAAMLCALGAAAIAAVGTGRRSVALGPGLVLGSATALVSARLIGLPPW